MIYSFNLMIFFHVRTTLIAMRPFHGLDGVDIFSNSIQCYACVCMHVSDTNPSHLLVIVCSNVCVTCAEQVSCFNARFFLFQNLYKRVNNIIIPSK